MTVWLLVVSQSFFFHSFFVTRRLVLERVTRFTHSGWSTNNCVSFDATSESRYRYFPPSAREVPKLGTLQYCYRRVIPNRPSPLTPTPNFMVFGVTVCRDVYSLRRRAIRSKRQLPNLFTVATQLIKPIIFVILPPTQYHSFFRNLPLYMFLGRFSIVVLPDLHVT